MIFDKIFKKAKNEATPTLTLTNPADWRVGAILESGTSSMKVSAVNACVEVITNSISKLPVFVMDSRSKEHIKHPLLKLLADRPNELMTPSVYKKLMETNRLLKGNAYALIVRSSLNSRPVELIPLPPDSVFPFFDGGGKLWYAYTNPRTGERRKLDQWDVLHYKAFSTDGVNGVSVLSRASEVVATAREAQRYEGNLYANNAQPSGVLAVEGNLEKEAKERMRSEWEKAHRGVDNAFRIAILDNGLKYQPLSISNRDVQFVESKAVTVEDIARFFGVPLYKINAGKQSYSSNEQNGIEYVTNTLHPIVTQCEEEDTYKLLFDSELAKGYQIRRNMMAELRGDFSSRSNWYQKMREIGVFSVDDIRALEDMPNVEGGDARYASLNYIPLDRFGELSESRNGGEKNENS